MNEQHCQTLKTFTLLPLTLRILAFQYNHIWPACLVGKWIMFTPAVHAGHWPETS